MSTIIKKLSTGMEKQLSVVNLYIRNKSFLWADAYRLCKWCALFAILVRTILVNVAQHLPFCCAAFGRLLGHSLVENHNKGDENGAVDRKGYIVV